MSNTNRKYTQTTYEQVVTDLQNILRAKEGPLADLGESSYGKTLIELFAANSDLMANWGESSFANAFLETATSHSSIYLGARGVGYSVRRPIPAKAGFGISLKRTGVFPSVKVNIPRGTQFTLAGSTLTAMDDVEFTYDRSDSDYENGLMKLTSGRAVLAEGVFKSIDFFSDGSQNQDFIVPDTQFSDYFGFGDPNYSSPDTFSLRQSYFTTVTSDASLLDNFDPEKAINDKVYWRISRRGFQDPLIETNVNDLDSFISSENRTLNYSVIIQTANDGRAQLKFSDGVKSAIPFGRITVSYFSTQGEAGNLLNVAGSTLNTNTTNILITQADGSESDIILADLNLAITTDVRGGINIESAESIVANAPQIYNSLDSLGSRPSYLTYLRRYADIKYANAYGEDILTRTHSKEYNVSKPNIKYANIVRFTVLKDLYRNNNGAYYPTDPFEYYIEGYKVNGLAYIWQYDYQDLPRVEYSRASEVKLVAVQSSIQEMIANQTLVASFRDPVTGVLVPITNSSQLISLCTPSQDVNGVLIPSSIFSANLEPTDFAEVGSELDLMLRSLNTRGYLTLGGGQHMYVPPIVHDFTVVADVILFRGMNFSDIKSRIRSDIYAYLKENTEFAKPIFRSKIESLIQKYPEVAGVNLTLKAKSNNYEGLDLTKLTWLGDDTSQFINQSGLEFDGFDITLNYDYKYEKISGLVGKETDKSVTFTIGSQREIASAISEYYKEYIAYYNASTGKYLPKKNLTEETINKFTSYIWARMINEMYVPIFEKYKVERSNGDALEANALYNVIESLKGWYFDEGALAFKETNTILNMNEDNGKLLFNYFVYTLEYIKLIRNILKPIVARKLVDEYGNITQYTNENEVIQFNISSEDINIIVESDSYASKERVK